MKFVWKNNALRTLLLLLFVHGVLTEELNEFIKEQEKVVKGLAKNATKWHADRIRLVRDCECSRHACSNDFLDVECVHNLGELKMCEADGRRVDYGNSIFRTPFGTDPETLTGNLKESTCVYKQLEDVVKDYSRDEIGWIYIGTRDGHFRRYPGTADSRYVDNGDDLWNSCRLYDPRIRPWYIGASTGPKDIVLVVDKSWSMLDYIGSEKKTKWDLVLDAVTKILDTFTFADFVSVVTFSDEADTVLKGPSHVRGQRESLNLLKEALKEEIPVGRTNFSAAFDAAFPELWEGCDEEPTQCSNCEKIILFLTDGQDTSGDDRESIKPSQMAIKIEKLQQTLMEKTGKRASIFTYSMSNEADDGIPRQIACANNGAWAFIGPDTNVLDSLNSYSLYEAAKRRTETPFWIEPYEDASGLGLVTTVAIPFYARGTNDVPDVFLGVVGLDIILSELDFEGMTQEAIFNAFFDRSSRCVLADTTPCEIQVYRNSHDERSVCADPYPNVLDAPPVAESYEPYVQCYEHNDHYYKRSSEELPWDEALSKCEDSGGELVSVKDKEELAFLANLASHDGSWIGARRDRSGDFAWRDRFLTKLKSSSDFWGLLGASRGNDKDADCVAIDTRGVIANLKARPCKNLATYICKFDSDDACPAGVASLGVRGYFKVPPLNECVDEVEALDETTPVKDVKDLSTDDVMCPLGRNRTNEELQCCDV